MIEFITSNYGEILGTISAFVLFFDRLAKLTPSDSDNKLVQILQKAFVVLGVKVTDNK